MEIATIIEGVSSRSKLTNGIAYTTNISISSGNIDV